MLAPTGYFGAPTKQPKRKGNISAENTGVIEKKHFDSPMVWVRKFQESWKETFPEVVHKENANTIYKYAPTCMSTLLTLTLLFVLCEFQLCQSAVCICRTPLFFSLL